MGIYKNRAFNRYEISKEVYNFIMPIYGKCCKDNGFMRGIDSPHIIEYHEKYYFIGTESDYKEMQECCLYLD